jgi:hypothetical protein
LNIKRNRRRVVHNQADRAEVQEFGRGHDMRNDAGFDAECGVSPSAASRGQLRPFELALAADYGAWRAEKLRAAERGAPTFVEIGDLGNPNAAEIGALKTACEASNMAFFRARPDPEDSETRKSLARFVRAAGLHEYESHRSGDHDGVVSIEVTQQPRKAGFIPYSDLPINWHTDGYYAYRSPDRMIRAMALYCVRNAASGGENGFFDPDIAYIRLRDADPRFIEALSHPQALTIPDFGEESGGHGAVAGPVFAVSGGRLAMRFTIRKRNVIWREDPMLDAARGKLSEILASDPLVVHARLSPGEGILCNNVLHDRTGFVDRQSRGRLLLRVRSYDVVGGKPAAAQAG